MPTSTQNLATALASVQGALPHFKKDAKANYGTYVTLDAIHDKILPLLSNNGLAWVTMPSINEVNEATLKYQLIHSSGEKLEGEMKLFNEGGTPQKQGSAITYAKRYAICAVIGITADDDDDGQAAEVKMEKTEKTEKPKIANPEAPATDKQTALVTSLIKSKAPWADTASKAQSVMQAFADDAKIGKLTKEQASLIIEGLTTTKSSDLELMLKED